MNEHSVSQFETRFQNVVSKMRLTCILSVLCWTLLAVMACFTIVIVVDYLFEISWSTRAAIVFAILISALAVGGFRMLQARDRWQRPAVAAEIENRFQDLGQSIRTSVQLNDGETVGVSPSLHNALNEEVNLRTQELRLNEAVPTGTLKIGFVLLGLVACVFAGLLAANWQWRLATSRAFLGNRPWTTISVDQGDVRVDEKEAFSLNTKLSGRTDHKVLLLTRESVSDPWRRRELMETTQEPGVSQLASFTAEIPKVKKPFEYQVVAGKYSSPIHHVDVRYPIAVESFNIELTLPEYTGGKVKRVKKGSFTTVYDSTANFKIEVDQPPVKAWLELKPIHSKRTKTNQASEPEIVELAIDGTTLSANRRLQSDCFYRVFAELSDGTSLRRNRHRIRIHTDRSPRISFDYPSPLIEVHGLAELAMQLRVADDFGLRRSGIVLQLNDDPEIVLEPREYKDIVDASGKLIPQTKAKIEALLPLEYLEMTVQDSISYYAFAEDNRPDEANRSETDLRFIDIRPFRRFYTLPEEGGLSGLGNGRNEQGLPALNEMIVRERLVINRTRQLEQAGQRGRSVGTSTVDGLIKLQNNTSSFAGQLGDRAAEIEKQYGIPEGGRISDQMYRAQEAMLASVDSLSDADYEVALLKEKEAARYLIDARRVLENSPPSRAGGRALAELRRYSMQLARKKIRPRNNQDRVNEITMRLKLASAQQQVVLDKFNELTPATTESENEAEAELSAEQLAELAEDESKLEDLRDEVDKQQMEIADEVDEVVGMIGRLERASELTQARTENVEVLVEKVTRSLGGDEIEIAIHDGGQASESLQTLADNIMGVHSNETAQRLGVARDLSLGLADRLRQIATELQKAETAAEAIDMPGQQLAEFESLLAQQLSLSSSFSGESALTIKDIFDSILDPEFGILTSDDQVVIRLQKLLNEDGLDSVIERTGKLSETIQKLEWVESTASAEDLAERFDVLSQRLDAMHREFVAPRIEQLRKLEHRTVKTKARLDSLESEEQINRWHTRTNGLIDDIDAVQVGKKPVEQIRKAMFEAGWNNDQKTAWEWKLDRSQTAYVAPADYDVHLGSLIVALRQHIRELAIGDAIGSNGRVPPKYENFVEQYMELLAESAANDNSEQ